MDVYDKNTNMPGYFRSCINRTADKRANELLTNMINNEFSGYFSDMLF